MNRFLFVVCVALASGCADDPVQPGVDRTVDRTMVVDATTDRETYGPDDDIGASITNRSAVSVWVAEDHCPPGARLERNHAGEWQPYPARTGAGEVPACPTTVPNYQEVEPGASARRGVIRGPWLQPWPTGEYRFVFWIHLPDEGTPPPPESWEGVTQKLHSNTFRIVQP